MSHLYSEGIEYEFLAMVSKLNPITMSALAALLPIAKRLQFFAQYGTREVFRDWETLIKSQSAIRSALFNFFPRPDAMNDRTFLQEYAIALVGLRVQVEGHSCGTG